MASPKLKNKPYYETVTSLLPSKCAEHHAQRTDTFALNESRSSVAAFS